MSLMIDEFAEKMLKRWINPPTEAIDTDVLERDALWADCTVSERYVYLEYYDEGGYSSIHKVMDKHTGKHLILKKSYKTNTINKEVIFMFKIYHKLGGLKIYDYYDDYDNYIIIMDDGGRSLEDIVCSHKKKIVDLLRYQKYRSNFFYQTHLVNVARYMIKALSKITEIHKLGIHHNDIKPENILVDEETIHIIDFGVSETIPSYQQPLTSFTGTLEYIPYEYVTHGSYQPWDHTVWCFGVMMHFLCLMRYPFLKEQDVAKYRLDTKRILKLPQGFASLIMDCLNKDPLKRPTNLMERLVALAQ